MTSERPKRVLFYLPVVTPWWFSQLIVPLIRKLSDEHDVHIIIPPLWRNTGIGPDQLGDVDALGDVAWYLLDGPDHPKLRSDASDEDELIQLVRHIAPDITLCRSADIATPRRFPGMVRFIMEGSAYPYSHGPTRIVLGESLFDHGLLPDFEAREGDWLDRQYPQLETRMRQLYPGVSRADFLKQTGLPCDRNLIGLPLEYEHEENFFSQHHWYKSNVAMIDALASELPEGFTLAVTNHPLNVLHRDNSDIEQAATRHGDRVALLPPAEIPGHATLMLCQHADGMIVGNSKSWLGAAAFGTPILRLSQFRSGAWLGAYDDPRRFWTAIQSNEAMRPDRTIMRRWVAYYLANISIDLTDPCVTGADIVARIEQPHDPSRWESAIRQYHARWQPPKAQQAA